MKVTPGPWICGELLDHAGRLDFVLDDGAAVARLAGRGVVDVHRNPGVLEMIF